MVVPNQKFTTKKGTINPFEGESQKLVDVPLERPRDRTQDATRSRALVLIKIPHPTERELLIETIVIIINIMYSIIVITATTCYGLMMALRYVSPWVPKTVLECRLVAVAASFTIFAVFSILLIIGILKRSSVCLVVYSTFGVLKIYFGILALILYNVHYNHVNDWINFAGMVWIVSFCVFMDLIWRTHRFYASRESAIYASQYLKETNPTVVV